MDIFKEIVEHYTMSSMRRFKTRLYSKKAYKRVLIHQKNGKDRIVFSPCDVVKMAQRYLVDYYLKDLKYSENAIAYTKGKSILNVAFPHIGNKYFLHLDIKRFFDSMNWSVFKKTLNNYFGKERITKLINDGKTERDIRQILCFRGLFRQGSVSSPIISNIYLFGFDKELVALLKPKIKKFKYTRYSDDIYISSSEPIDKAVVRDVSMLLKQYSLRINYEKIQFSTLRTSVNITGISLTADGKITLHNSYKKIVKRLVYLTIKNEKPPATFNSLFGHIYYLIMCDPDYFNELQNKYSKDGKLMLDVLKSIEQKNKENEKENAD